MLHASLDDVGEDIEWGEAIRLVEALAQDTSTRLCASLNHWDHPVSTETLMIADLYDIINAVVTALAGIHQTPQPHPIRPWKTTGRVDHYGNTAGRTRGQIEAILTRAKTGTI